MHGGARGTAVACMEGNLACMAELGSLSSHKQLRLRRMRGLHGRGEARMGAAWVHGVGVMEGDALSFPLPPLPCPTSSARAASPTGDADCALRICSRSAARSVL